jgi:hypothetical protein
MDFPLTKNALALLLSNGSITTSINHHFTSNNNNTMRFEIVQVFNTNSDDAAAEAGKV